MSAATLRLLRPLRFGPATEVWLARLGRREVVARRHAAPPGSPFPPPADPAVLAALRHPGIERFLASRVDEDGVVTHVFVRLRGRTLAEAGVPDAAALAAWLRDAALALRWMHERSPAAPRLHGDVSPGNVFVTEDGRARLIDLAATRPGLHPAGPDVIWGTLPYLAPEILAGGPCTAASDVWSLAATAVSVALGRLPWAGARSPHEVLAEMHASPAAGLATATGPAARDVVAAMLHPDPARRPTAERVCRAL
ncbi:MAG: protein kinase [Deltaproteobacteria bacterium]|nr:protein kinase [Deltaproteobacteria bacterium]